MTFDDIWFYLCLRKLEFWCIDQTCVQFELKAHITKMCNQGEKEFVIAINVFRKGTFTRKVALMKGTSSFDDNIAEKFVTFIKGEISFDSMLNGSQLEQMKKSIPDMSQP